MGKQGKARQSSQQLSLAHGLLPAGSLELRPLQKEYPEGDIPSKHRVRQLAGSCSLCKISIHIALDYLALIPRDQVSSATRHGLDITGGLPQSLLKTDFLA